MNGEALWTKTNPRGAAPDRLEALLAGKAILRLAQDFPFASNADRTAWLMLALTLAARETVDGPVPAFAIVSDVAASGKTLLARRAARLATGKDVCASFVHERTFARDMGTALFADPRPVLLFENVGGGYAKEHSLIGDFVRSGTWRFRVPRERRTLEIANRASVMVTSNRLSLGAPLAAASLRITLKAGAQGKAPGVIAQPGLHDSDQVAFFRAVTTILRAADADRASVRRNTKKWAWPGFEAWVEAIARPVLWIAKRGITTNG